MRLTCPNCAAKYEVEDAAIPRGGRDVQCSACGHTWFQYPKDVALEMRAADLDDDEDEDEAPAAKAAPRIDKTVLDVLREEAERELAERKRDRSSVESQADLGLTRPTRSKAAPSRIYGEDDPAPQAPAAVAPNPDTEEAREAPRRRKALPDIEELTSTLEPGEGAADAAPPDLARIPEKGGTRRGITLVMLVAAAFVVVYLLAPFVGAQVPPLAPWLAMYVDGVDGLRAAVAGVLRGLLGG